MKATLIFALCALPAVLIALAGGFAAGVMTTTDMIQRECDAQGRTLLTSAHYVCRRAE